MLSVPDLYPSQKISEDVAYWCEVYARMGVTVQHLSVVPNANCPVVVAVFRDDAEGADREAA